ncbi:cyclopropane-fatty-acyl-phospholipid synthase family protein [Clostridium estertheticum]|uniref:Cyclopropane-fatty-acyl-phospholipid synthase family protein n=1 Tax=Clostridium estertheticum TaxID=238834 RepID=A0AA47EN16_9CLOT|nr:cyclopropane-fatty-acyl-phospholipid synthase family protein [Clostridium estertheticum]MBU3200548.1 cyclopropane-fatty-acyl-phospholipid synthase family protein [Clostridium estertheticum]WAG63135.1 cyclopropane-fatty-acyl-phospholipid synthase family protein [Clostridium estertheticum]WAG67983.1 cyclopropane-fatty-acyl-phospholipid synthase family protein [Clostridium estertheticum]
MTDKLFYKTLLKSMFSDPFEIRFWDGDEEKYGEGESKFKIILNEPIPKGDIINNPSIALGEGYMTKKLEVVGSVQSVIESLYNNKESFLKKSAKYQHLIKKIKNSIKRSKDNIEFHYDIGNDFYKLWLDDTMSYSCGYFKNDTNSLYQAQINKINHILKKLNLKEGQTLLDIGCGWGELIITAAKQYKVKAVGITLSEEQFEKVNERIKAEGLEDLVEVKLEDYRQLKNLSFDRIVSIGMLEHVGLDNLSEYFHVVNSLLNDKGLSLVHCITGINEGGTNTWIDKYIFPGGHVPAIKTIISDIAEQNFELIDIESLRRHYGKTLEHWAENFENALPIIEKSKDEMFIRMWRLYLNSCAASFNCGNINLHQILFAKGVNNDLPLTREYLYK